MDTDSLSLALAEKKCIFVYELRKGKSGNCYVAGTDDSFTADA